jgi:uncharacterized protein with GYD domain
MTTKNEIHALTAAEIDRQIRIHSERRQQIVAERAAMFSSALKNGTTNVEAPIIDADENAAQASSNGIPSSKHQQNLAAPRGSSLGGKLEFWYFDYGAATAYSVIDYPDEVAAATAQLSTNAAGFARVTMLTAEEMDQAVAKWPPVRVPQQQ